MELNRSQRVMLWKFCTYGFLKSLRFFEPFLLLFFTIGKGFSYTQFGLLIAVREIAVYVLEIPTGIIADVTGRRRAMVIAFSSYIASFAVFSFSDSFWPFIPAMILFGAGEAFRSGTHKSMIMQHLDIEGMMDRRIHYYGTTRGASRLGSAVSALLAGAIVFELNSYRYVFAASTVPYVLGLLLMLTYPAELDGERTKGAKLSDIVRHTVDSFRAIWRTPELLRVLLNASAAESFFKIGKDYLQPILNTAATTIAVSLPVLAFADTDNRRAAVLIAVVYSAIHINEFVSSRLSGRLADRIGHLGRALNILFLAFAALFVGAGVFLSLSHRASGTGATNALLAGAVLMLFFFYTLNNLRMPMITGFLSDRTAAQQRATVLSVFSQIRAVLAAGIAPLFGVIADNLGIPFVFLAGGLILLVAGAALRLREDRAAPRAPEAVEAGPGTKGEPMQDKAEVQDGQT